MFIEKEQLLQGTSEKLQQARDYVESKKDEILSLKERNQFHHMPEVGWMNDPNGFSVYQGEYHLFYQYFPYDVKWGPMHWGHVKSRDFIKWEYLPAVSYTHLTLPTNSKMCRSRWSPYH